LAEVYPGIALINDHGPYAPTVKSIIPSLEKNLPFLCFDIYADLIQFSKRYKEAFFSPNLELLRVPQLYQRIYDHALDDSELGEAINDFSLKFITNFNAQAKVSGPDPRFSYAQIKSVTEYMLELFMVGLLVDTLSQTPKGTQLVRAYNYFCTRWSPTI
jgi:hypothetical protein